MKVGFGSKFSFQTMVNYNIKFSFVRAIRIYFVKKAKKLPKFYGVE